MIFWTSKCRAVAALVSLPVLLPVPPTADAMPPMGAPPPAVIPLPGAGGETEGLAKPLADAQNGETIRTGGETEGEPTPLLAECPPEAPYRLGPKLCADQTLIDQINDGWQMTVDPDGQIAMTPPPSYDPVTGQWGHFSAATQACDPQIKVQLKQAALAGSQLTRAISDRQLAYAQTDPIEAVNNPRKDGAGGVCTIDLFAVDLGRLLGGTYEQIKNLIDTLSQFSVDSLFGAACPVVNSVFGNLQNQLLQDLQSSSPLSAFQQFVNALTVGYLSPLQSFLGHGLTVRPTVATIPGIVTAHPLQVSYVPGKGYLYLADFGSGGHLLVVHIAQTPLAPGDAVAPTAP